MGIGSSRKSRSDKAKDQVKLGGILATFGKTSQPMDDPAMPNQFYGENGANTDQCCIRWTIES